MDIYGIYDYNDAMVFPGIMALPGFLEPDPAFIAYQGTVDNGQANLAIQEAAPAATASCGLNRDCIERAIREKINEDGLDASVLGNDTEVFIRGIGGADYTELIFRTTPARRATEFTEQICTFGFSNSGGVCEGNAGYTILAGGPHRNYDYTFRDNNEFNGLNVQVSISGVVAFDIDQGNPAGGLAGLIVHGIQVVVNGITGRDNTYGCGRRVP
jgi:hypothetical protein